MYYLLQTQSKNELISFFLFHWHFGHRHQNIYYLLSNMSRLCFLPHYPSSLSPNPPLTLTHLVALHPSFFLHHCCCTILLCSKARANYYFWVHEVCAAALRVETCYNNIPCNNIPKWIQITKTHVMASFKKLPLSKIEKSIMLSTAFEKQ